MQIPIRALQRGLGVLLEDVGLVQVIGLTWFPDSVEIEFDGTNSPLARRVDRAVHGVWSGRFDDFPVIEIYHHERYPHDRADRAAAAGIAPGDGPPH